MTVDEARVLINFRRGLRFHVNVRYSLARDFNTRLVQMSRQSMWALLADLPGDTMTNARLDGKDLVIG